MIYIITKEETSPYSYTSIGSRAHPGLRQSYMPGCYYFPPFMWSMGHLKFSLKSNMVVKNPIWLPHEIFFD